MVDQHSVNEFNRQDSAVKWQIYIYEIKIDEKIYILTDGFSAIAQLHKSPITAILENLPDSRYSAYGWK